MKKTVWLFLLSASLSALAQHPSIGGFNVYYGNLHNHCNFSDGTGTVTDAYSTAKYTAKYDFFGLSDHAEMMNSSEWELMKKTADEFNEDSVFASLWGFEWSSPIYGHSNIIGSDAFHSSVDLSTISFSQLVSWVNSHECVAFFNHPGDYGSPNVEFNHFSNNPSQRFVGMELWNGNRGFDHFYDNNGYFDNDGGLSYFDEALTQGWRIGAMGGEDDHSATWGSNERRMAILTKELSRSSMLDAIKARRFYSTLDRNIEMSFKIDGYEMGSIIHSGSYPGKITLHDANDEVFTKAELICKGNVMETFNVNDVAPVISFSVTAKPNDYYYIRVYQQDGDRAISSPIFVDDNYIATDLPGLTKENPAAITIQNTGGKNYIVLTGHDKDENVVIVDLTGRVVASVKVIPGEHTEMPDYKLPAGLYLAHINGHPEIKACKLFLR